MIWKNLDDPQAISGSLALSIIPEVGILNDYSCEFYGSFQGREEGLIIGLFEPHLNLRAVSDLYRPMLSHVAKQMKGRYHVTYMGTKSEKNKIWIESEFGVVSFPTIVVLIDYPGKPILYTGDMSTKALLLFLEDLHAGCYSGGYRDARHIDMMMGWEKLSEKGVCDAMPVQRAT